MPTVQPQWGRKSHREMEITVLRDGTLKEGAIWRQPGGKDDPASPQHLVEAMCKIQMTIIELNSLIACVMWVRRL